MIKAPSDRSSSRRDQAFAILEQKLDPSTLAIVQAALDDSDRMAVIRDAFLEGRDAQAVQMIRDLDPIGIRKVLGVVSGIRKVLGVVSGTTIVGSQIDVIAARPQLPFRATHLVVSPRCAAHFNIDSIRVGNLFQFVNCSPVAADLFTTGDILHGEMDEHGFYTIKIDRRTEAGLLLRIDMPVCEIGQELSVCVTSIDHDPHEFYSALLGQTATY